MMHAVVSTSRHLKIRRSDDPQVRVKWMVATKARVAVSIPAVSTSPAPTSLGKTMAKAKQSGGFNLVS